MNRARDEAMERVSSYAQYGPTDFVGMAQWVQDSIEGILAGRLNPEDRAALTIALRYVPLLINQIEADKELHEKLKELLS